MVAAASLTHALEGRIVTISESRRRLLHDRLVGAVGEDAAEVPMEHLPPAGWGDLATNVDLARVDTSVRAEIEHGTALLRAEIAAVETSVRAEIEHGTALLRAEMAALGSDLRGEMAGMMSGIDRRMAAQTRTLMLAMVTTMAASFGASVALTH
jgi:hypothetical protein